jgi:energy-coupling factor transport system ATP-binding protein
MNSNLIVNIKRFHHDTDSNDIIKTLSFSSRSGEIVLLEGPVGCGKTTILKIIAGIIPYFEQGILEGNVRLGGDFIGQKTFSRTAFCFQHSDNQLIFDTVKRQFLSFQNQSKQFFNNLELTEILDKSVMDLSKGQRKYVALTSTICKERELYLFDEPLDLLDDKKKDLILDGLKKLSQDSIVIISSHDKRVREIATRRFVYKEGVGWKEVNTSAIYSSELSAKYKIRKKESNKGIFKSSNLGYEYENSEIVDNLPDLSIGNNEIVGLVGNNASGKTTLLKLISGFLKPSKGEIEQRDFNNFGFLFQNVNRQLFSNSVYEELFVGLNKNSDNNKTKANNLLNKLRLRDFSEVNPIFLSGGQKQKLAFASLLMHSPEILFLDEIFTNLDRESIEAIFNLVNIYREKNNLAIVLTDQNDFLLKNLCDAIYFLD